MTDKDEYILPVCLTCGVRDDETTDDGFCQNGHDDWLEWADFAMQNQYYKDAVKRSEMDRLLFDVAFMDNQIKQFQFKDKTK